MIRRLIEDGFMCLSPAGYCHVYDPVAVDRIFHEIIGRIRSPSYNMDSGEMFIALEKLLLDLSAGTGTGKSRENPRSARVATLSEEIARNPLPETNFRNEARKMGLSFSHFRKLFATVVGRSPYEHLLSCRIKEAIFKLRNDSSLTVKEIAHSLNFNDYPHFCRTFRKRTGMSPGKYRRSFPINWKLNHGDSDAR